MLDGIGSRGRGATWGALAATLGLAVYSVGAAAAPQGSGGDRAARAYPPLSDAEQGEVRTALASMKAEPRGPYRRILWFCNDGTTRLPSEGNCSERGGGYQHAQFSDTAIGLGTLGFHPGTILQALPFDDFVDVERANYRLRELVVEEYLVRADDGWVLRRARFYRGARQIENEEARGRDYLRRLLGDAEWRAAHPLLAGRLAVVVPHGQSGVPGARIRQLAEEMAVLENRLQDLRIKIHSRPGPDDLETVRAFRRANPRLEGRLPQILDDLESDLTALYGAGFDTNRWTAMTASLEDQPVAIRMREAAATLRSTDDPRRHVAALAVFMREARDLLGRQGEAGVGSQGEAGLDGRRALALLDAINYADALLTGAANRWVEANMSGASAVGEQVTRVAASPPPRRAILRMMYDLVDAAYGSGWLSSRERRAILGERIDAREPIAAAVYREHVRYLANAADWGQATLHQTFGPVLERYRLVEPAVVRFEDDALRGSVLLPFSNILDVLERDAGRANGVSHSVFSFDAGGDVMGLNPGIAVGELHIIRDESELERLDPEGIYIIPETAAELGRLAGILTLRAGSRLSHVQLLARSLGIPNAVVAGRLVEELEAYEGQEVFYAVSNLGTVVLKLREDMNENDVAIVDERAATPADKIDLEPDKLDLSVRRVLSLDEVDLDDSGRVVGPKAANLARLRRYFPDRVAAGLVIPFGAFRQHIDRDLRGTGRTLYEDLAEAYQRADRMQAAGISDAEVRSWILVRLREVREAIEHMTLVPEFESELRVAMRRVFGADGSYGVFIRSDTNVEDLPQFTGAGLNLTVMNQIAPDDILVAIKRVWASPFSERSFTWRQQLLDDPLEVYPSVVLLASVPVEASGVLVTKDLNADRPGWWTVTVSEGVGGVVEGEPAETLLLPADGSEPVLLSSARAIWQKILVMSGAGGIERVPVGARSPLLTEARARDLRAVVSELVARYDPLLDEAGEPTPWDIEFGFLGDTTQLFQIRPLVTNRRVRTLRALALLDGASMVGDYRSLSLEEPPNAR